MIGYLDMIPTIKDIRGEDLNVSHTLKQDVMNVKGLVMKQRCANFYLEHW